jgi:hypothetical protein
MTLTVEKMRRCLAALDRHKRERRRVSRWPRLARRAWRKRARAFRSQHTQRRLWGYTAP